MHYIASRLIPEIDIDLMSSLSDNNIGSVDLPQPCRAVLPFQVPRQYILF